MMNILDYVAKLSASDRKTLSQKALKTTEEVGELAKVVLPYEGAASTTHRFVAKERILEEVADVLLCALSIGYDLGYTTEEIEATMLRKAAYWEELQLRETRDGKAVYPVPYEIHVTVKGGLVVDSAQRLEEFKTACAEIGVKPLLIDMHNHMGKTIMLDCQTSSVHIGDNTSAITEVRRISAGLRERGFVPIREKVETVPWHPAAPSKSHATPTMPKNCYFEAHFNIVVDETKLVNLRQREQLYGVHLSRNAFKRISDTEFVMMATLRHYEGTYEEFKSACDILVETLTQDGFDVPKTIIEFSVYDTNVEHDSGWIGPDV
jgi:NTP pyrophosphatase (non-canonical NTP hydrolase)